MTKNKNLNNIENTYYHLFDNTKKLIIILKIFVYILSTITIIKNVLVIPIFNTLEDVSTPRGKSVTINLIKSNNVSSKATATLNSIQNQTSIITILSYGTLIIFFIAAFFLYRLHSEKLPLPNIKMLSSAAYVAVLFSIISFVRIDINFLSTSRLLDFVLHSNTFRSLAIAIISIPVYLGVIYTIARKTKI